MKGSFSAAQNATTDAAQTGREQKKQQLRERLRQRLQETRVSHVGDTSHMRARAAPADDTAPSHVRNVATAVKKQGARGKKQVSAPRAKKEDTSEQRRRDQSSSQANAVNATRLNADASNERSAVAEVTVRTHNASQASQVTKSQPSLANTLLPGTMR